MFNKTILVGRLVRDPELRNTSNGIAVTNFTLAVERNYTNNQGERDVDFIKVVTWRKLAETVANNLNKGRLVLVEGSLEIRKNENNGRTYENPEIQASNVRFLDWPNDNNGNGGNKNRGNNNNNSNNYNNGGNNNGGSYPDLDVPF